MLALLDLYLSGDIIMIILMILVIFPNCIPQIGLTVVGVMSSKPSPGMSEKTEEDLPCVKISETQTVEKEKKYVVSGIY